MIDCTEKNSLLDNLTLNPLKGLCTSLVGTSDINSLSTESVTQTVTHQNYCFPLSRAYNYLHIEFFIGNKNFH